MREIRMSLKELDQVAILESIQRGEITQKEGARILNLSVRQVKRKVKRYAKSGTAGLAHQARGRPSNRGVPIEIRQRIVELLLSKYRGFGPTFATEKLNENENIRINHETVRRIMIAEGLLQVGSRKVKKFVWREPKHHFGELVQVDGSKHKWFGPDKGYATLLAFIDDATNKVELMFADQETTENLAMIARSYIKKHGRPRALYSDKGGPYKVNTGPNRDDRITQLQRMLWELDIPIIHANTPQAKGRVERLYKTLQDRLVKELALQNIKSIGKANQFLQKTYIDVHNEKFSKESKSSLNLHRSAKGYDLNSIFCRKTTRILNSDNTVQYKAKWFLLSKEQPLLLKRNSKIIICEHFDNTITLMFNDHRLDYKEIEKRLARAPVERRRSNSTRKPSKYHPWFSGINREKSDISKKFKR